MEGQVLRPSADEGPCTRTSSLPGRIPAHPVPEGLRCLWNVRTAATLAAWDELLPLSGYNMVRPREWDLVRLAGVHGGFHQPGAA